MRYRKALTVNVLTPYTVSSFGLYRFVRFSDRMAHERGPSGGSVSQCLPEIFDQVASVLDPNRHSDESVSDPHFVPFRR